MPSLDRHPRNSESVMAVDPMNCARDISRRAFGQLLGAATLGGALPDLARGGVVAEAERNAPDVTSTASSGDELCDLSATELASRIRRKQVSAREVMAAHLARIERANPRVNAI